MSKAILKIYSDIGVSDGFSEMFGMGTEPVSAKDVSDFLDENESASEIIVKINSRGGDVQEGWAIYDLLTNSGKKIKTVGEGKVYSIATIIFMAGSEREMMKNADGLIHNPYIPPYTLADKYESDDLIKIAEGLAQEEEKILNFYAEKTGTESSILADYMKEETKLSAEDMLKLGFATKIIEPVLAFAYIKPKNNFIMNEDEKKTWGEKLDTIIASLKNFSRISVKNVVLTDVDGNELTLEKESGDPAVGDVASPDGTFVLESGDTIVVEGGAVTSITPAASDEDSELEVAKAKITELEAKIATLEAVNAERDAIDAETETARTEALAMVAELTALKNTWKPNGRIKVNTENKVGAVDLNRVRELIDNKPKS